MQWKTREKVRIKTECVWVRFYLYYLLRLSVWVRFYLYYLALILFHHSFMEAKCASNTTDLFINVLLFYIVKI
jgi:hypothetical protein